MISAPETAAIVLSAGYSRRMGRFKPLLPLSGHSMIHWCIDLFKDCEVSEIHVVVGHRHESLAPVLAERGVCMVVNPNFAQGMFSSVKAGIRSLSQACEAFFILPVDIPLVRPATVRRLLEGFDAERARVVVPCFANRPGHPPLVSRALAPAILAASEAGGLRAALARWQAQTLRLPVPDRFILQDADGPEDYRALETACHRWAIPDDDECDIILARSDPEAETIIRHGQKVAHVADVLTAALRGAGIPLDARLVRAAALVHDLAKGSPDHARMGAGRLRELGFDAVADIVASHHEIDVDPRGPVSEAEVVYLADKLVVGDKVIAIEERFAAALARFGDTADARANIQRRRAQALASQARVEAAVGRSVDDLLRAHPETEALR